MLGRHDAAFSQFDVAETPASNAIDSAPLPTEENVTMSDSTQPKQSCRVCGSEEILPVVYGLPTPETVARAAMGEVLLGGCVIMGEQPGWRCSQCGTPFDMEEFAPDWVKELLAEIKARRERGPKQ
jgi:hypothetical protein